jgi:hypothetical protein
MESAKTIIKRVAFERKEKMLVLFFYSSAPRLKQGFYLTYTLTALLALFLLLPNQPCSSSFSFSLSIMC